MVLLRALAAVSAMAILSATAVGCGAGLSKEDADVRCDQEKAALSALWDDNIYASCEQCFMDCGDQCVRNSTTPLTYTCAGDSTSTDTTTTTQ